MATKVQLTGGAFQDAEGNVLALGKLIMRLSADGSVSGSGQIASGVEITITLDGSGNVVASPVQSVWGNDQILPINSYYTVTGYKASGQRAWGPNNQQVNGSGGTFDVGTWIPNTVLSWTPPLQAITLQVNDVNNTVQSILNLEDSATVTFTDDGDGGVHATASVPGVTLQTEGTPNTSQTLLNIKGGNAIVVSNPSGGIVQIDAFSMLSQMGSVHGFAAAATNVAVASITTGFSLSATGNVGPVHAATASVPQSLSAVVGSNPGLNFFFETDGGATSTNWNSLGVFQEMKTCIVPVGDVATSMVQWYGFYNGDVLDTHSPTNYGLWVANPTFPFFGFRGFAGVDTNWQCFCGTGAAQTVVDSGVAIVSGTFVRLRVKKVGSSLLYYVNGILKATISTNLPANSTLYTPVMGSNNTDGFASLNEVRIAYFWWQNID